jgi:acylglycerol lipase
LSIPIYNARPRLGIVAEVLRAIDELAKRLDKVNIMFLVVHDSTDEVTDPEVSHALYAAVASKDNTIKIYDGMLHSLLFGEPNENIERVRGDILAWLNERCTTQATHRNIPVE